MSELKHAAQNPAGPDYALIGFYLLEIAMNMIGKKDIVDREHYVTALSDAAKLCFEVDNLKNSMIKLYKRMEGMK